MKKEKTSIRINAIMNAILSVSGVLFPLITFPYVSRVLLPTGTGKVRLALSFVSYFTMFAQLGIPTYGIRACAKVRDDKEKLSKTVHELVIIHLITSVLSYLAFLIALFMVPKLREERLLYLIASSSIFLTAISMEWLYKALEKYRYITTRSIIFKFISLVLTFLLIKTETDYVMYGFLSIFANAASYIFNFVNARKYISFKRREHYDFKPHLKGVMIFFAMSCATMVYTHLDTIMLGFMMTDADVGYYDAAVKIRTVLMHVVTSLGAVLLPRSSYYIAHGMMDEFYKITKKAINFVFILSLPLTIYFMMFARPSVLLLSGKAYESAIAPMQIIMPTLFFVGISNILGMQMLVPLGKEKIVLYSEICGAAVDLAINWILIPRMASAGAAIGTVVAEAVVIMVQYAEMKKEVSDSFKSIRYGKILIALFAACFSSYWLSFMHVANIWILLASAIVFFSIYGLLLILLREPLTAELAGQELGRFKRIIRRKDRA